MTINVREDDSWPYHCHKSHDIPLIMQNEAKNIVPNSLKSKVIMSTTSPTEWCSHAHIVKKPGTNNLRLVID